MDPIDGIEKAASVSGSLSQMSLAALAIFMLILALIALAIVGKMYLNTVDKKSAEYVKIITDNMVIMSEMKAAINALTAAINERNRNHG